MQDEVEMRTEELARWTVERSKSLGADCASAEVSHDKGLSVTVRMGEVDAVEHTEERVLTLSAWIGRRKGCASTSDFSERSLEAAVQAADAAIKAMPNILSYTYVDKDEAIEEIRTVDHQRKAYHNYYCEMKWGDARAYDLTVKSDVLGMEGTAEMLIRYIRAFQEKD